MTLLKTDGQAPCIQDEPTTRLLIVDDHCLIRQGIFHTVRSWNQNAEIHEADCVAEALALCARLRFDLVLLDLGLPDRTGMVLLEHLRAYQVHVAAAVISEHEEPAIVARCMELGAVAFIRKGAQAAELRQDLVAVLQGLSGMPDRPVESTGIWAASARQGFAADGTLLRLTPRERDVMSWLAQGYSNKKIARELGIFPGTVKVHVGNIIRKMHLKTRAEVIAKYTAGALAWPQKAVPAPAGAPWQVAPANRSTRSADAQLLKHGS